MTNRQWEL